MIKSSVTGGSTANDGYWIGGIEDIEDIDQDLI